MKKKNLWLLMTAVLLSVGVLYVKSGEPIIELEKPINIQEFINKSEMISDLDSLVTAFERIHPNPYRFRNKNQCDTEIETFKNDLADSLKIIDFWRLLDKFVCGYNDAHVLARHQYVLDDYVKKGGLFFPLPVKITNGKLLISENDSSGQTLALGTEIVKINSVATSELITELLKHSKKETARLDTLAVSDDFGYYLWKSFDWDSDFNIQFLKANNNLNIDSVKVNGIKWEEHLVPDNDEGEPYMFSLIDNNIGYMKITEFIGGLGEGKKFNNFCKKSFKKMRHNETKFLIIDFRGHHGGADSYGETLAKYFASEPFRRKSKAYWKITPEFKEAFDRDYTPKMIRWCKPLYLINEYSRIFYGTKANEIVTIDYELKKPIKKEKRFNGDVFLITDHKTFSASSIFAEMFKYYNMGTIVGQPTGSIHSFSTFAPVKYVLSNSKLSFRISSVYSVANNREENYIEVEPHIFTSSPDDPLDYILDNLIE